jgi:hydrogenase nickel incorporation protein HypB
MCATCGCSSGAGEEREHHHHHPAAIPHDHGIAEPARARTLRLERDILERNAAFARANKAWLEARQVSAVNLMSAPGSGKTRLLEATIARLAGRPELSVLEGDQETDRDAARIRAAGARAEQINTGTGCHLDAHDVGHALERLDPPRGSLVAIENVGNLVCPALFELGEQAKVVVLSVTEGEDKPLKYPHAFRAARALVLSKLDLARYVGFELDACAANARAVNPNLRVLPLSAVSGEGMDAWCDWLRSELSAMARFEAKAAG